MPLIDCRADPGLVFTALQQAFKSNKNDHSIMKINNKLQTHIFKRPRGALMIKLFLLQNQNSWIFFFGKCKISLIKPDERYFSSTRTSKDTRNYTHFQTEAVLAALKACSIRLCLSPMKSRRTWANFWMLKLLRIYFLNHYFISLAETRLTSQSTCLVSISQGTC